MALAIVAKLTALAEKMNAEIGGKAPQSRRPAGVVENPVTLFPTTIKPKGRPAPKAKAKAEPGDLSKLQPGDTINAENAPQIADTPFTLTCEVTTAQRDAILIAHGGASTGYRRALGGSARSLISACIRCPFFPRRSVCWRLHCQRPLCDYR